MCDLIKQMRKHVASYTVLSPHRQACLDMCDRIEELESGLETIGELRIQAERVLNQRIEELETAFKELRKALKEQDDD